eukprot:11211300-Lingulodinium_polyedra.AAC.1
MTHCRRSIAGGAGAAWPLGGPRPVPSTLPEPEVPLCGGGPLEGTLFAGPGAAVGAAARALF